MKTLTNDSLNVLKVLKWNHDPNLYGFSLRVSHLWFKLKNKPFCVLLYHIIGRCRHLLINLYRNLRGSYTTWRNCINSSYILATKVCGSNLKTQLLNDNREAVSFFLNKFSATHLWYKIIPCTYECFTNDRECLQSTINVSNLCEDLFRFDTALYQAFVSLNVNIGIIWNWIKFCPKLRKVS